MTPRPPAWSSRFRNGETRDPSDARRAQRRGGTAGLRRRRLARRLRRSGWHVPARSPPTHATATDSSTTKETAPSRTSPSAPGIAALPGGYGLGAAVGDVDNDGRPDLFVTRWRGYALYRNRGDGTFEDVTEQMGLGWRSRLADLGGVRRPRRRRRPRPLRLSLCRLGRGQSPAVPQRSDARLHVMQPPVRAGARPDHVFRNDGGRFPDVTAEAGIVDHDGRGLGVVAADLDDDGRIDLFVANDKSANFLFRNLGEFRFEEVGHTSGVAANAEGGYQAGMGVAYGDLDGDGRSDLAVTNYYGESTTLYQNLGAGIFTDRTTASGLAAASRLLLGFGIAFLDVNNDGRLDLLTANGHTDDLGDTPYRMPAQLLAGVGDGRLIDISERVGPGDSHQPPGARARGGRPRQRRPHSTRCLSRRTSRLSSCITGPNGPATG